jgi:hypothetical protein
MLKLPFNASGETVFFRWGGTPDLKHFESNLKVLLNQIGMRAKYYFVPLTLLFKVGEGVG